MSPLILKKCPLKNMALSKIKVLHFFLRSVVLKNIRLFYDIILKHHGAYKKMSVLWIMKISILNLFSGKPAKFIATVDYEIIYPIWLDSVRHCTFLKDNQNRAYLLFNKFKNYMKLLGLDYIIINIIYYEGAGSNVLN